MMTPTSLEEFIDQATVVVGHYEDVVEPIHQVRKVHFNFMARGEPLSNPIVLDKSAELYAGLANLKPALEPKFLISSIIPEDFQGNLSHILSHPGARLYYSLYSMDKDFRRRWLPRAMDPNKALDKIADYQHDGGAEIALHRAFIEGENDSEKQLEDILKAVSDRQIKAKFNLVRYNPYDTRRGREPEEDRLKTLFNIMAGSLTGISSRIVPKVGYDIKASCGMFMLPEELEVL
jgi:23S rRNA (adenine2503-C2)-methyltransferase